jgi:hypothetical protein
MYYDVSGTHHLKFQQYVDGYCVLGYQEALDTTWQSGLLYKLSQISTSLLFSMTENLKFW